MPENSINGVATTRKIAVNQPSVSLRAATAVMIVAKASPVRVATGTVSSTHQDRHTRNGAASATNALAPTASCPPTMATCPTRTSRVRIGVASIAW
ncbi:MAG: hypothetical protein BWY91_02943 [bacterium ADurb.BinA028]|nr:MAG: hypothetical protein BWY91_02943 [bacterium ADurb.BinA028]